MTRPTLFASILVCASVLTFALISSSRIPHAIVIALLGVLWLVLQVRGNIRFMWLMFLIFGLTSVLLIWLQVSHWLALTGLVADLLAWDLTAFESKLRGIPGEDIRQMETAHFSRLALVLGIGLVGILTAGFIQIDLTLGSALILALLAIWGVSTLVYRLRSRE